MSIDSLLRAIAVLTCIYTIGLFVTVTSTAALNAVAHDNTPLCADRACRAVAVVDHHAAPASRSYPEVIHTAALFFAGAH